MTTKRFDLITESDARLLDVGSTVTLVCNGPDAEEAAAALEGLIRERFGEPD